MFRQLKYETPINFKPLDQSRAKRGFGVSEKTGPSSGSSEKIPMKPRAGYEAEPIEAAGPRISRRTRHGLRSLVEVSFQRRRQLFAAHGQSCRDFAQLAQVNMTIACYISRSRGMLRLHG
jgi:hypothetical protein